ncbi:MAG: alanine dehydrogenase [Alphaproteobacteria bacterium]|nr:alanine dehydrogenase [Alphaproteobacteria bacterium]
MRIGVPSEIKIHEHRVGLTPNGARELTAHGHEVFVQTGAGLGAGFSDAEYAAAGAALLPDAKSVFDAGELIVKVKEPQPSETAMLTPGHVLFTYLHLAPDPKQAEGLRQSGCIAIAYETVTDAQGRLPLLRPMSEVAGRMSVQVGAAALQKSNGGRGVLLGGVPGVTPARVVILGAGVSGSHAAEMALGLRADVTVMDRSIPKLAEIDQFFRGAVKTRFSTQGAVAEEIADADLVIGAVLVPGAAAPRLISRAMLKTMKEGSVLVDIAIDQGGCFETSRPTTHQDPTYIVDGIVHYCVANMPGAVARTSTLALTNATLPFTLALADKGARQALNDDIHLAHGLNVAGGEIAYEPVARDLGVAYVKPDWLTVI